MSLGKRLIKVGLPACLTDTTDIFGDSSGVALYSLDYDASDAGGNYDGTPTNVEFGVDGQINYGARFNGSSSQITLPNGIQNSNMSVSLWLYSNVNAPTNKVVIEFSNGYGLNFNSAASGKIAAQYANSNSSHILSNSTISSGQWYHIVGVFNSSSASLYINGTSQSGGTVTDYLTSDENTIGSRRTGEFFSGSIDQVRIFSKALSQSEVDTLYAETACVYTCTTDTVNYPSGTTPVAYYKLDNSSEDFSTGGNDGTDTNIEYRFGRFGQAAVFNGSSSYIDTGIGSLTNNFTFSAWLNADDLTGSYRWVFGNWASSAQDIYLTILSDGTIEFNADGNNGTRFFGSAGDFTLNTWHHLVVSMDAGTYTVYLDNISLGSGATTNTTFNNGNNYQLGKVPNSSANEWSGKIDQVRIYSIALDSDQVSQLYNEKPCADTSNFKTVLYDGNSSTQYISNVGFEPDFVWIKNRTSSGENHSVYDSVRGNGYTLYPNLPNSQDTGNLLTLNSNGFTLNTTNNNLSTYNYVAWCWKGGGDAVSNTDGTITSQVSANTEAGFSIVKYTGNGGTTQSVGHGLSSAPELVILKRTNAAVNWFVFEKSGASTRRFEGLNTPYSSASDTSFTPSSSTITWAGTPPDFNGNTNEYIMYCFHSVSGYQKVGSYTGSTGGVTENIGFQPRWIMIKDTTDNVNNWVINDAARDTSNPRTAVLFPNLFNTEGDNIVFGVNFTLNGFEIPSTTTSTAYNKSGNTYIYLAIA